MCTHLCCRVRLKWEDMPLGASFFEDVPLMEFTYLVFTRAPCGVIVGDSGLCCCVPCLSSTFNSRCLLSLNRHSWPSSVSYYCIINLLPLSHCIVLRIVPASMTFVFWSRRADPLNLDVPLSRIESNTERLSALDGTLPRWLVLLLSNIDVSGENNMQCHAHNESGQASPNTTGVKRLKQCGVTIRW